MNLKAIKQAGYQLGLEAELGTQMRNLKRYVDEKKFEQSMQCCNNIGKLLSELSFVINPVIPTEDKEPNPIEDQGTVRNVK